MSWKSGKHPKKLSVCPVPIHVCWLVQQEGFCGIVLLEWFPLLITTNDGCKREGR